MTATHWRTAFLLVLWSMGIVRGVQAADEPVPLRLIRALPVEGPENNQPSGLTLSGDTLFTVSDKHDGTIFRLELEDDRAVQVPHLTFHAEPPDAGLKKLDFEGLASDEDGGFYLASETAFRVLRCRADGERKATWMWMTPDLRPHGEAVGLFQTSNANLEGIALLPAGELLVCAERQPRGLIEVDFEARPATVRAFNYNDTKLELPGGRNADFTGLHADESGLYAVVRNAEAICRIEYGESGLVEGEVWSYRHIVNDPALRYVDRRFGQAEGLCMDEERVYLIIDNNGDPREADPEDRRPLLLIMERPRAAGR